MIIPLAAIRDLSIGRFPRVMNPAGLHFISVTCDDAGQSRRVILSPFQDVIGMPNLLILTLPRDKGIAWTAITTGAGVAVLLATVCVALLIAMVAKSRPTRVAPESRRTLVPAFWTIAWHAVLFLAVNHAPSVAGDGDPPKPSSPVR